jgi:hydrogenase nickel incorporation protein HypA/HybF
MHELSLADAIVAIATEHAGKRRVTRVEVRVGALRQVVPDALGFAFELVAHGTPVEGAQLVLEEVPARVACRRCTSESEVDRLPLACSMCGSLETRVIAGEELEVEAIEVESARAAVVTAARR